jgi:putative transposase
MLELLHSSRICSRIKVKRSRSRRVQPSGTWHLDEVFVRIGGKQTYLWRAVDDEGEVLDVLAQSRRNKRAALKLMRKLLKKQGYIPDKIVTDKLGSYSAALRELGLVHLHVTGGRLNNRAEVSHQPTRRRERRMGRFKSHGSMQRFLSVHDAIYNHFNHCPAGYVYIPERGATPSDLPPNSPSNARLSLCGVE